MGNPVGSAGIAPGRSTGKLVGVTLVACALALGAILVTFLIPTAKAQDQQVVTVSIRDFFFDPADITVEPGTTVMLVNEGSHAHTVTSDDGQFDSEALMPGDSFMVTFSGSGTLTYHCEIHDFMTGSVTVSESGGTTAPTSGMMSPAAPADSGAMDMASSPAVPADSGAMDMTMGSGY